MTAAVFVIILACWSHIVIGQETLQGLKELVGSADNVIDYEILYASNIADVMAKYGINQQEIADLFKRVAEGKAPTITKTITNPETNLQETITLDFQSFVKSGLLSASDAKEKAPTPSLSGTTSSTADQSPSRIESPAGETASSIVEVGTTLTIGDSSGSSNTNSLSPIVTHTHTDTGVTHTHPVPPGVDHVHKYAPDSPTPDHASKQIPSPSRHTDLSTLREHEAQLLKDLRVLTQRKSVLDDNLAAGRITLSDYQNSVESNRAQQRELTKTLAEIQNGRLELDSTSAGTVLPGTAARKSAVRTTSSVLSTDFGKDFVPQDAIIDRQLRTLQREIDELTLKNKDLISSIESEARTPKRQITLDDTRRNVRNQERRRSRPTTYQSLLEELYKLQSRKREIERILRHNARLIPTDGFRTRHDRVIQPFESGFNGATTAARRQKKRIITTNQRRPLTEIRLENRIIPRQSRIHYDIGNRLVNNERIFRRRPVLIDTGFAEDNTNVISRQTGNENKRTSLDPNIIYSDGDITISKTVPADGSVVSGFSHTTSGLLPPYVNRETFI